MALTTTDTAGHLVKPGDTVTDFRGDTATFVRATRAQGGGKTGKVLTRDANGHERELYDRVYNLTVTEQVQPRGWPFGSNRDGTDGNG
jgi:hypothetical protein